MPTSQKDMILAHLYSLDEQGKRRGITVMEALGLYRVVSLTSRIAELRAAGHNIITKTKIDNTGKRYARFFLASR
jgi:hypothetical protein